MSKSTFPIALVVLVFTISSCEVHRDVSRDKSYWKNIEKGGKYQTLKPVYCHSRIFSEYLKGRSDLHIISGIPSSKNYDWKIIPAGTIIEAKCVYLDSAPIQYAFISYYGVVRRGPFDGARVDFTSLLNNTYYGYCLDPDYLKPLPEKIEIEQGSSGNGDKRP